MDTAFIAGLTAISVYTLLVGVLYFPASYNYLFEALLAFVLLIYLVRSSQRSSQIWLKSLLWFCLGQLFLSYSQPQQAIFVSFSFSQLVYISLSIICIYFINYAQTSDKKDGITC